MKIMNPNFEEIIRKRVSTYDRKEAIPKGIELWMGETGGDRVYKPSIS